MYAPNRELFFVPEKLSESNPNCMICHSNYQVLHVNTKTTNVTQIIEALKTRFSIDEGEISVEEGGRLIYDLDFEDNAERFLHDLGIVKGKKMIISFQSDATPENAYIIQLFINER